MWPITRSESSHVTFDQSHILNRVMWLWPITCSESSHVTFDQSHVLNWVMWLWPITRSESRHVTFDQSHTLTCFIYAVQTPVKQTPHKVSHSVSVLHMFLGEMKAATVTGVHVGCSYMPFIMLAAFEWGFWVELHQMTSLCTMHMFTKCFGIYFVMIAGKSTLSHATIYKGVQGYRIAYCTSQPDPLGFECVQRRWACSTRGLPNTLSHLHKWAVCLAQE